MMNKIAELIIEYLPYFGTNKGFYTLPLTVYGFSMVFHLLKFFSDKTPKFTRVFCALLGFAVGVEFLGTFVYVMELSSSKVIDGINVRWMIVMLVAGIAQLLTPFGVNAAECFYIGQIEKIKALK